jgi:hypothetical protein
VMRGSACAGPATAIASRAAATAGTHRRADTGRHYASRHGMGNARTFAGWQIRHSP